MTRCSSASHGGGAPPQCRRAVGTFGNLQPHGQAPVRAVPPDPPGRPCRRRGRLSQAPRAGRADPAGQRRALDLPAGRVARAREDRRGSSARRWTRSAGRRCSCPYSRRAELWEKTGRITIPELFRLADRGGRPFILSMTHEETVTFHFSELKSYRDLPKILYHFQTKGRDEPRPRGWPSARARVHHEGRVQLRPRRGGPRRQLPEACGGVPSDVRPLRDRVLRGRGGVGDDGRVRVDRLPGAFGIGREHARHVRERGLRGGSRDRPGCAAATDVPRAARQAARGGDPGDRDDRRARRVPRHRPGGDVEGDARDEARRDGRARARPGRRPARGGEARRSARQRLPPVHGRRDPRGLRRRPRLARAGRLQGRDRRRQHPARGPVRRRGKPHRLAPARRRVRP